VAARREILIWDSETLGTSGSSFVSRAFESSHEGVTIDRLWAKRTWSKNAGGKQCLKKAATPDHFGAR